MLLLFGEECEREKFAAEPDFDGDGDDDGALSLALASSWLEEPELELEAVLTATDLAKPKSASLTVHSESRSKFEGLMSRCSTDAEWTYLRARSSWYIVYRLWTSRSTPARRAAWRSVSMASKTR